MAKSRRKGTTTKRRRSPHALRGSSTKGPRLWYVGGFQA